MKPLISKRIKVGTFSFTLSKYFNILCKIFDYICRNNIMGDWFITFNIHRRQGHKVRATRLYASLLKYETDIPQ